MCGAHECWGAAPAALMAVCASSRCHERRLVSGQWPSRLAAVAHTRMRLSRPRGARRAQCRRDCSRVDALACLHARGCAGSLQSRGCACAPAGASERLLDMDSHSVAPAAHARNHPTHHTHLSSAAGRFRALTARAGCLPSPQSARSSALRSLTRRSRRPGFRKNTFFPGVCFLAPS